MNFTKLYNSISFRLQIITFALSMVGIFYGIKTCSHILPDFSKKVENIRTGYRYEKPQMGKVY